VAWEACRRLYNAEKDLDALEEALRRGDVACVNAYINTFETILLLERPDELLREGGRIFARYGDAYLEITAEEKELEEGGTSRRALLRIITRGEKRVEL